MKSVEIIIKDIKANIDKYQIIEPVAFQALWYSEGSIFDGAGYLALDIEAVRIKRNRKKVKGNVIWEKIMNTWTFEKVKKVNKKSFYSTRLINLQPKNYETTEELINQVKHIGNHFSDLYKVPFYFPAIKTWDDECPNWWKQDEGINCKDCNLLVLPISKWSKKGYCRSCFWDIENKKRFIKDFRDNETTYNQPMVYADNGETKTQLGGIDTLLLEFVTKVLGYELNNHSFVKIILTRTETLKLKEYIEEKIDKNFNKWRYNGNTPEKLRKKVFTPRKIMYKNLEYELLIGTKERKLYEAIREYNKTNEIISTNSVYLICVQNGLNYRDKAIFWDIYRKLDYQVIQDKYSHIVEKSEIDKTLKKLINLGCISCLDNKLVTTQNGEDALITRIVGSVTKSSI